jgi:YfaZ precursor
MTQIRTGPMAVLALALIGGSASAQDPDIRPPAERYRLRLHYNTSKPELTGDARKGTADSDFIDFNEDLGFQDERTFDARGIIQFRRGKKLRLSYTALDYQGDQDAPKTFTYGDTRYERFTRVRSSAKGAYYSADIQWDFVQRPWGFLGLIVGAKAIDVDVNVVDVADNAREVDTFRVPIPVAGIAGRAYSQKFSLEGEISGLSVGARGHMYDANGTVRFHVSDRLALQAGYRLLKLTGKDNDDELNLRMAGWQFGLELSL